MGTLVQTIDEAKKVSLGKRGYYILWLRDKPEFDEHGQRLLSGYPYMLEYLGDSYPNKKFANMRQYIGVLEDGEFVD